MHMKKLSVVVLVLAFLLTACTATAKIESWNSVRKDTVSVSRENYPRIDGSTSTLNIVNTIFLKLVGGYAENLPTSALKTLPAYKKLIAGELDLIFVPYASAEVLEEANEAGVKLKFFPIAAEALVFITPADNPTENITMEQVRSIYLDYGIENWQELGGPDKSLIPICRNSDSGSQSQMDNMILELKKWTTELEKTM